MFRKYKIVKNIKTFYEKSEVKIPKDILTGKPNYKQNPYLSVDKIEEFGKEWFECNFEKYYNSEWIINNINYLEEDFLIDEKILYKSKIGGEDILEINISKCKEYLSLSNRFESLLEKYDKTITFISGLISGGIIYKTIEYLLFIIK